MSGPFRTSSILQVTEVRLKVFSGRHSHFSRAKQPELLEFCTQGETVMVIGTGGSIDAELNRQIFSLEPTHPFAYAQSLQHFAWG